MAKRTAINNQRQAERADTRARICSAVPAFLRRVRAILGRGFETHGVAAAWAIFLAAWAFSFEATLFAGTPTSAGPWQDAIEALCTAFTGPIGTGLSFIAIVIGGLMYAFGEGGSKSQIAGLIFMAGVLQVVRIFLVC